MNFSGQVLEALNVSNFKPKKDILNIMDFLIHCLATRKSFSESMLLLIKEFNPDSNLDVKSVETSFQSLEILKLAYSRVATTIFIQLLATYKNHIDWHNKISYVDISVNTLLDSLGYSRDYRRSTFRAFLSRTLADINEVLPNSILVHKYFRETDSYRFTFVTASSVQELRELLANNGTVNSDSMDKHILMFESKNKWR